MLRFILQSYSFKRILILSVIFVVVFLISNKIFDIIWRSRCSIPIINLNDVYKAPAGYDNFTRINLKLVSKDRVAVEGNKKFRINDNKSFDYYDTISIKYPETTFEQTNKIFMKFEESGGPDSIYLVVSKSNDENLFWKQIFYSSVIVSGLNNFSKEPSDFRIDNSKLVNQPILDDNDSLISGVYKYFNDNAETLGLAECGTNSIIFRGICEKFGVPCRVIGLQGGDADQEGYFNYIGYPLHALCEVYSSKHKKWFIVDPSYGFRYRQNNASDFLNAVEISNMYLFMRENEIIQDSVLFTKRTLVGRDYFKFYENIFYKVPLDNSFFRKFLKTYYNQFNYNIYQFSNQYPFIKNGYNYLATKSFMYFIILILYINSAMIVLTRRLFSVKKPK